MKIEVKRCERKCRKCKKDRKCRLLWADLAWRQTYARTPRAESFSFKVQMNSRSASKDHKLALWTASCEHENVSDGDSNDACWEGTCRWVRIPMETATRSFSIDKRMSGRV